MNRISIQGFFLFLLPIISVLGGIPLESHVGFELSIERVFWFSFAPICLIDLIVSNKLFSLPKPPAPFLLGIIIWLFALILSTFAFNRQIGAYVMLFGYFQRFCMFCMLYVIFLDMEKFKRLCRWFVFSMLLASFFTLYVFFVRGSANAIREAGFVNVNTEELSIIEGVARYGANGGIVAWLAIIEGVDSKFTKSRLMWFGVGFYLMAVSLLALRREYLLAIMAGVFLLFVYKSIRINRFLFSGVLLFVILGFSAFVISSPDWQYRLFEETRDTFNQGQDPRLVMMQTVPSIFIKNPVLGTGMGSYPMLMAEYLPIYLPSEVERLAFYDKGLASHNSFLTAAISGGAIALFGLILFFFHIPFALFRLRAKVLPPYLHTLVVCGPLIWVQVFFSLFFQDGLASTQTWIWIAALAAILTLAKKSSPIRGTMTYPNEMIIH